MGSEILKQISMIIANDITDPRVNGVSVLSAKMSGDLKYVKVTVSILGDKTQVSEAFEALKGASAFIRRELASVLADARTVPQINFALDNSHINPFVGKDDNDV